MLETEYSEGISSDVYISYARSDISFVRRLVNQLRDEGLSVWFNEESFLLGSNLTHDITKAISSARVVLVVLSERSEDNEFINFESALALESKKLVIPVISTKDSKISLPYILRDIKKIDLSDDASFKQDVHFLAQSIKQHGSALRKVLPLGNEDLEAKKKRIDLESKILESEIEEYSHIQLSKNFRLILSTGIVIIVFSMIMIAFFIVISTEEQVFTERLAYTVAAVVAIGGGIIGFFSIYLFEKARKRIADRNARHKEGEE
ncbi:toll/interleukin-1 receptor domain-containing protein [Nitrosomonas sp. Nm166]|uniref:toll/interleukin-1 receptor domain-containing protein n=1 Tax=Nitrosomonas sp. Nm166 TaxID=1881054 RepID=UPI0015A666FC|nr:toll/interleukin-1 receptor domain-containing protein [Nitrosomonas sp. Nm166]